MLVINSSTLFCFVAFLAIFPQNSTQQSVVQATCTYIFDQTNGLYTCRMSSDLISSPTDVLNITGTHSGSRNDGDVQMVSYPANNMHYFNGDIMKKFENLVILRLNCYTLKEINQDAFDHCPNLEQFESTVSNVTSYPPQMFKNCLKLKNFRSNTEHLTEIPEIFGDITSLEKVELFDNQLTSLPEKFVQNKPNLKIFKVQYNSLTELPTDFFLNCTNLEEVDVSGNNFEDQTKLTRAFNENINLKSLTIYSNRFPNFDFTFFSQFNKLEMLTAGAISLTQISWQSLPSSLTALRVSSVGEDIPENAFSHLTELTTLSLTGLGITSLHKDTFKSQTALKMLSIQSTSLVIIHPELFASQANLVDLELRYNKIEQLPAGIFTPLVNLGMSNIIFGLKVSGNKVKRLNINSFGEHQHLQYLDFSANEIDAIQRGLFSQFNSNIYRANFNLNVCINKLIANATNLNEDESLQWCFDSWEGITTTTTTTTDAPTDAPPTTPGGAGNRFKKIEVFGILMIGIVGVLVNFMK
ncbi:hypothetical protein ACKWTF_015886 [Chironomus riparius]